MWVAVWAVDGTNASRVVTVPFESLRQAEVARNTLRPDPILKPSELVVEYAVEGLRLVVAFNGASDRVLRVAVSSTLENLKTVVECFEVWGEEGVKRHKSE